MPDRTDFERFTANAKPSRKDEDIEALQNQVQSLTDRLNEERFAWSLIIIIIFDAFIFTSANNWGAPIALVIVELILIVILAKRFGVEEVAAFLYRLAESFGSVRRRGPP